VGEFFYKNETFAIRGAIFDVYKTVGEGFLEAVYQECLEKEFAFRNIPYVSQPALQMKYKGVLLQQRYYPDLVCYDKIVVELKAVKELAPEHTAQIINYLRMTNFKLGLLVNFGSGDGVIIKRYAN
jgi:GxxExxY protein